MYFIVVVAMYVYRQGPEGVGHRQIGPRFYCCYYYFLIFIFCPRVGVGGGARAYHTGLTFFVNFSPE
jgi:hypothetical protein